MTSPFKDKDLLEKEITSFINKFKAIVKNQSNRISDYFEMSCYNYVVQFYEHCGYDVKINNLISGAYRYKCSTAGVQTNFSNFLIKTNLKGMEHEFEIHHNLAVQSSHDKHLFTTPDIVVVKKGTTKVTTKYYDTKRQFSYAENSDAITFFEVKHFNPYPELIFNFIGTVHELKKTIISNNHPRVKPFHLAPSILTSGKPNKQTLRIKESLEKRYCVNIIYDMFHSGSTTFSMYGIDNLKKVGYKRRTARA